MKDALLPSSSVPADPAPVAQITLGPYDLHTVLGRGGMGAVWGGVHRSSGLRVAVKVILDQKAHSEALHRALDAEVRMVASLVHPRIVIVHDQVAITDEAEQMSGGLLVAGSPCFAMELGGQTLHRWLRTARTWVALKDALLQILDALSYAHARNVIHLDLKPANVLQFTDEATGEAVWKLTDFGIAHTLTSQVSGSVSAGTLGFMAPEQRDGRKRDMGPWTDLYAVGCLAWQMTCGPAKLRQPDSLFQTWTDVPEGFEGWMRALLAQDPSQRPQFAADAAHALRALGDVPIQGLRSHFEELEDQPTGTMTFAVPLSDGLEQNGGRQALPPEIPQAPVSSLPPAPLSADWQRPVTARPSPRMLGVGLSLYGLRRRRMVGRSEQRDALWKALQTVHQTSSAQFVVLQGEAGVGKTRLAEWLCERAHEVGGAYILRAVHGARPGPTDGVVMMVEHALRTVGLPREQVAERVRGVLGWDDEDDVGALTELIRPLARGESPGSVRIVSLTAHSRLETLARFVDGLTTTRPAVMWLDDAQWGPEAVAFAAHLAQREQASRVVVVLTARADVLKDHASVARVLASLPARSVSVPAMTSSERTALVKDLLGMTGSLAETVAERTGGHPLFAVQLVADWVERGILVVGSDGFVLRPGATVTIPDAIHELWSGRVERVLDGQPATARTALELAALLGEEVAEEEWASACEQHGVPLARQTLEVMFSRGLAVPRDGGLWSFAHGMLAESVARIATEQDRLDDETRSVATVLHARGVAEVERGQSRGAAALLTRAGRVAEGSSHRSLWARILDLLGETQMQIGENELAEVSLTSALQAAKQLDDRRCEGDVLSNLATLAQRVGDVDRAVAYSDAALAIHREFGNRRSEGIVLSNVGVLLFHRGEHERAVDCYEQALLIHRELRNRQSEGFSLINLGAAYRLLGRAEEAFAAFRAVLDICSETGNQRLETHVLSQLGALFERRGEIREALEYHSRALTISREGGIKYGECVALACLGSLYMHRGLVAEAFAHYEEALAVGREIGERTVQSRTLAHLGAAFHQQGRTADAVSHFEEALLIAGDAGVYHSECLAWCGLGDVLASTGENEAAFSLFAKAIALSVRIGSVETEGSARGSLGLLLGRQGDFASARAELSAGESRVQGVDIYRLATVLRQRAEVERLAGNEVAAVGATRRADAILAVFEAN